MVRSISLPIQWVKFIFPMFVLKSSCIQNSKPFTGNLRRFYALFCNSVCFLCSFFFCSLSTIYKKRVKSKNFDFRTKSERIIRKRENGPFFSLFVHLCLFFVLHFLLFALNSLILISDANFQSAEMRLNV